ncbi:MAG: rhodanese-like domain-containing protein [Gammaproteobacteria bacterium]
MKKQYLLIVGIIIFLSACNSSTTTTTAQAAASDPLPQSGGYSNIENAKLDEFIHTGVTVVDIRRQEEWRQTGILEGSKTITFFDNNGQINPDFVPQFTAITDPEKPVILICRTGNRTKAASKAIARQLGYKKVFNVTRGITGWISEKRPVVQYR